MWATRTHRKELPSFSVQRWQRWAPTMGEWPIKWLVSRPVSTRIWSRMVQPRLYTTRIWARVSTTSSIVAVTTTSIDNTNRHGIVHQCNGGHLHSNTLVHQPNWTTSSNRRNHHDRQWCSNPRLWTMVWNIVFTPSDEATKQTHPEDSHRNRHLGLWLQMDSLHQPTRPTHRDSILRLWCETTNFISHSTDASRLWDQHEWELDHDTSKVLWESHHTKGWTTLHQLESFTTSTWTTTDHQEWRRGQPTSHDSTNTIGHIRSKTSQWQQRHMDDEQPRIHRAHPLALEESTLHTIQQWVSHQHRSSWGLQKDHHQTNRKGRDHHRGWLSTEGEEGSEQDHRRISMG